MQGEEAPFMKWGSTDCAGGKLRIEGGGIGHSLSPALEREGEHVARGRRVGPQVMSDPLRPPYICHVPLQSDKGANKHFLRAAVERICKYETVRA